jgi:hypothetical protein
MKRKHLFASALLLGATAGCLAAQSAPAETSADIGGKKISIKYSAPSVRGRQIFGAGGVVSKDGTYPVWRAGANNATALHTDADLMIGNLKVPKGDYTIYVLVDPQPWKLIISKEKGQWGTEYHPAQDLGRVNMNMSKPAKPVETYKMTLASTGGDKGKLTLEWENVIASVDFTAK